MGRTREIAKQETVRLAGLSAVRSGSEDPDHAAQQLPFAAWLGSIPKMLALGGTRDIQAHMRAMTGINASGHLTVKIERRQPALNSHYLSLPMPQKNRLIRPRVNR
jgi:hypothetical protein